MFVRKNAFVKLGLWYEYNIYGNEDRTLDVIIEKSICNDRVFKDNYRYFHLFHNHNKLENNQNLEINIIIRKFFYNCYNSSRKIINNLHIDCNHSSSSVWNSFYVNSSKGDLCKYIKKSKINVLIIGNDFDINFTIFKKGFDNFIQKLKNKGFVIICIDTVLELFYNFKITNYPDIIVYF